MLSLLYLAVLALRAPLVAVAQSGHEHSGQGRGPSEPVYERGPVLTGNFPDPCIIQYEGIWYSFATMTVTQTASGRSVTTNIQIAQSPDFNTWSVITDPSTGLERDALPSPPSWVNLTAPNTWAPDVNVLDDGTFVMYFAGAVNGDSLHHCVGAATSRNILGPYTPLNKPLVCPLSQGGAIDPAGFKDWTRKSIGWGSGNGNNDDHGWQQWHSGSRSWAGDDTWGIGGGVSPQWSQGGFVGQRYLVYKVDGNSIGNGGICLNTIPPIKPTPIMLQAVAEDGLTLQGEPISLLDNRGLSDDGVVEAPSLVKGPQGQYVLFFSSGCYSTADYTVSYAISNSGIKGPYQRIGALLSTGDDGLYAPGGASVLWDSRHFVFHADQGTDATVRNLYVGLVEVSGDTVYI